MTKKRSLLFKGVIALAPMTALFQSVSCSSDVLQAAADLLDQAANQNEDEDNIDLGDLLADQLAGL